MASTNLQATSLEFPGAPAEAEPALAHGVKTSELAEQPTAESSENGAGANDLSIEPEFKVEGSVVLILCGLIASGKSTFAESLQSHFPQFIRCNQDDLGDRKLVEQLTRRSLAQGSSVCVDRTNFNASQRWHWIKIAREFPGTKIWVIVFDTPYEICAARLQHRTGHPTITTPELGLQVLSRFASDFEPPRAHEGYDRILYLKPSDIPVPEYSRADISAILQRVRDSEPVVAPTPATPSHGFPGHPPSYRGGQGGRGNYSQRGGWRGRGGPIWSDNRRDSPPQIGGYAPSGISTGFRGWSTSARGHNGGGSAHSGRGRGGGSGFGGRGSQNDSTSAEISGRKDDNFTID